MTSGYATPLPAALLLFATPGVAQTTPEDLSVSGSMRLRYESIDNQARAGFNRSDQLAELRTIVKGVWKLGGIQFVTEIYDSRAWGANTGTPLSTGEVNTFEPVQAYVQADLGSLLGPDTATRLQAGRFTFDFGSRRIVASDDYRNTTNGYTGLRADFTIGRGFKAMSFYLLPQTRLPDDAPSLRHNATALDKESFAAVLWGGLLAQQRKASPLLTEASFVHFGERDAPGRPTRDRSLNNLGARVLVDPRPLHFDGGVEVIYQWGETATSLTSGAPLVPVSATFLRAHAGYSFAGRWKPRLLLEFDRASGDGLGRTCGRFDPLFGMRRADLGPAGLYNTVGRSNIVSPGVRLEVTPSNRFDAFVGYRAMWLADSHDAFSNSGVRDASGRTGAFAGHQVDARLRYWLLHTKLRLELNGTLLARGRFLEAAPNGRAGTVRYGSVNLTAYFP